MFNRALRESTEVQTNLALLNEIGGTLANLGCLKDPPGQDELVREAIAVSMRILKESHDNCSCNGKRNSCAGCRRLKLALETVDRLETRTVTRQRIMERYFKDLLSAQRGMVELDGALEQTDTVSLIRAYQMSRHKPIDGLPAEVIRRSDEAEPVCLEHDDA